MVGLPSPHYASSHPMTPADQSIIKRVARQIREFLKTLILALLLFFGINLATARVRVEGSSMNPSLHDGQFVILNRLAYRWSEPERGDIIVFRFPLNPDRRFIKRVIGLPGDVISVVDGQVQVNGVPLVEPYISEPPRYSNTWTVELGKVFVLGDNRNNSSDSQAWGSLGEEQIIGKAIIVYWPLQELGFIPHYDLSVSAQQ